VQCILEAVVTFFGTENSEPVMLIVVDGKAIILDICVCMVRKIERHVVKTKTPA
jgi:hypothetical protein